MIIAECSLTVKKFAWRSRRSGLGARERMKIADPPKLEERRRSAPGSHLRRLRRARGFRTFVYRSSGRGEALRVVGARLLDSREGPWFNAIWLRRSAPMKVI